MDGIDTTSAVDDSYETIHFSSPHHAPTPSSGEPLTLENLGYNGPRSGHWTVANTAIGSAIDDGCPTVHGFVAETYNTSANVQAVKGDVVERLARATLEERKVGEEAVARGSVHGGDAGYPPLAQTQSGSLPVRLKGFYIPKADNYGIQISGKNGKTEVVRQPQVRSKPAETKDVPKELRPESLKRRQTEAQERVPSARLHEEASVSSHGSHQSRNMVRIVAKDGQEVFVELPPLRFTTKAASWAASQVNRPSSGDQNAAKRDAKAAKAAQQLREERNQQERADRIRGDEATMAAHAMMSGALPVVANTSSPKPTVSLYSARSSNQSSALAFGGMFGDTSNPPLVASSKTSLQTSQRATSARSHPKSSQRSSTSQHEQPVFNGWQEVGEGIFDATGSGSQWSGHAGAQRLPAVASMRSSHRESGVKESKSLQSGRSVKSISQHSYHRSLAYSAQWQANRSTSQHNSNDQSNSDRREPTIYAGKGWISPHPLSVAATEFQEPPDAAIRIPSRNGDPSREITMTFQEWKQLQRSENAQITNRRNYSRSTSGAGTHSPGSWGHRNGQDFEAGSVRSIREPQSAYQSPRVESVGSERKFEHQFDGAREVDGQTYLRMPWDEREQWKGREVEYWGLASPQ